MKKFALIAAGILAGAITFAAPVYADSPGELSNAPTNYKVRNVTTDGSYSQSVAAACNEVVKYSITVANSDYGMLNDVTLKADLDSGAINISAKDVTGSTTAVAGKVTVNVANGGSLNYVDGSTVRIASDGVTSTKQANGIAANGVNVGDLNGSTYVFVQFQAKVSCKTQPKTIKVCELDTNKIVTINESDFDADKYSKNVSDCATPTTELPNTGAGSMLGLFAAVTVAGAVAHRVFGRRFTRG